MSVKPSTDPAPSRRAPGPGGDVSAPPAQSAPGMKSLRASISVLDVFSGGQRDWGVNEIAQATGLSKSHVSKVLAAFCDGGMLARDPQSKRYAVGVRLFAIGQRYITHDRLSQTGAALMRQLVDDTGHSARLSVLDGERVLYLMGVEGPLSSASGWRAGMWLPLHSTAAGQILLAFMEPAEARRLLSGALEPATPRTITEVDELEKKLAQARRRGYVVARGENIAEVGAIAVPLFGERQSLLGSLSLSFPARLVKAQAEAALAAKLHRAADLLSQRVGCELYPFAAFGPEA
jgi:DNA-binding IclR family transcriptional regulator